MKRSAVNKIMREADEFIRSFGFILPPFAYWSPDEFKKQRANAPTIVDHRLGWDSPTTARASSTPSGCSCSRSGTARRRTCPRAAACSMPRRS